MGHPFLDLASEYESWVASMQAKHDRLAEIEQTARRLTRPEALANFAAVRTALGIPEVVQAVICEREDGCDFTKNPGQGDPLTRPSVHVPKGRPPLGAPPNDRFPVTWQYAAIDAFSVCDRLNDNSAPWSLAYACWKWEGYNGFGYRAHGIRSPYVVGGTNLQQPGKYIADNVFRTTNADGSPLWDHQLGCLPIARRMIELVPSLAFGDAVAVAAVTAPAGPSTLPAVGPPPITVGGSLTGTRWVQSSANLILQLDPPLAVDGSFGRRTRDAVRALQTQFNLPQTGLVDDSLCNAIDDRIATMRPSA